MVKASKVKLKIFNVSVGKEKENDFEVTGSQKMRIQAGRDRFLMMSGSFSLQANADKTSNQQNNVRNPV